MNLDDLRNLIESEGGKVLIVENGKPTLVVSSFEEYRNRNNRRPELFQAGQAQTAQSNRVLPEELEDEPLKIEDLPV